MTAERNLTVTYKVSKTGSGYIYQKNKNDHRAGDFHESSGGHMWFSLNDGISEAASYGFSSQFEEMRGPGEVTNHDNAAYQETQYEVTLKLTKDQEAKRGQIYFSYSKRLSISEFELPK